MGMTCWDDDNQKTQVFKSGNLVMTPQIKKTSPACTRVPNPDNGIHRRRGAEAARSLASIMRLLISVINVQSAFCFGLIFNHSFSTFNFSGLSRRRGKASASYEGAIITRPLIMNRKEMF